MVTIPVASAAEELHSAAVGLLRRNDLGGRTVAAADLYPHQWSWDSAFIAVGWAHVDLDRAARELTTLFAAQWANGKVPHIVFNPTAPPESYWPGREHWACLVPDQATAMVPNTSGLLQPPLHAIAAACLWEVARQQGDTAMDLVRAFLGEIFPRLMDWHAYLLSSRDPEGSGLVSIYHPWESGMDNSPRWDEPMAALGPAHERPGDRPDLRAVGDLTQRPDDLAYSRLHGLVAALREDCYDDVAAQTHHPFVVKDVFASGVLVAANKSLLDITRVVGARGEDRRRIRDWWEAGRQGLQLARDPRTGLSRDFDVRGRRWLAARTVAGFSEFVAGTARGLHEYGLARHVGSPFFGGHPRLRWAVPPSTSPFDPGFHPRRYWRGPSWPVITWLLWRGLRRARERVLADRLREAALAQIWCSGGFPEYVEPFTGEPLGSLQQSWTAAVTLDWLAQGERWVPQSAPCSGVPVPAGR